MAQCPVVLDGGRTESRTDVFTPAIDENSRQHGYGCGQWAHLSWAVLEGRPTRRPARKRSRSPRGWRQASDLTPSAAERAADAAAPDPSARFDALGAQIYGLPTRGRGVVIDLMTALPGEVTEEPGWRSGPGGRGA